MTHDVVNLVLAGVGGQGSVLANQIVARAADLAGHDVVTSEVHGMAQRGGSVVTTVRFGRDVHAPKVPKGEADFVVAFERLEALRFLPYLRPTGVLLVNDQRIVPMIESLRTAEYPDDVLSRTAGRAGEVVLVPGLAIATELGNTKLTSTVLLGALSVYLDLDATVWKQAIADLVPPKTIEANLDAFDHGARWLAERHEPIGPAV
ncbi:MAG: indolepyruvate oxidoreductase subunit beta [Gemmatimonadota bacterium]